MAIGKQKGKAAALAVQREKYEFVYNARHGPLQIVICTPDPAGHGGVYKLVLQEKDFIYILFNRSAPLHSAY